ncbi:phage portal protein [Roseimaritima ulvae]|uniref:Phage portal protein n=1 Tax=Roseimaritima ulvae TaxID=980254 RepID=A0A5B9QSS1_9BACT|nr:phage portal protein [Roseimaritima ulvae]QEG40445.1 Phage portal protein [Roseimaritima ulvae]
MIGSLNRFFGSLQSLVATADTMVADGGLPAKSDWSGFFDAWGSSKTSAGIAVTQESAMTSATVYACTQAIAETVGSLPGLVYESVDDRNRERAKRHRVYSLLHDSPNPLMNALTFYEMGTMRALNRGNFFAEIERNGRDEPIALWPIHPSRVKAWRMPGGELEYHVYTDQADRDNPEGFGYYVIPRRDMFNLPGFGSDGVIGRGVISFAMQEIGLDIATQRYGSTWFGNGARPGGLVKHPSYIDDDERRQIFRDDMNSLHGGMENWNKLGILWHGVEYQQLAVNAEEAQFLGTRELQAKTICRFYKVPPAMVQIYDEFKFGSVDAMLRTFTTMTIRPWAVRWESAIRQQLLHTLASNGELVPVFAEELSFEFLMNALLRGDAKTQAEANAILRNWGVMNADEWRAQENMNPIPGGVGEHYLVPSAHTTIDRMVSGDIGRNTGGAGVKGPEFNKAWIAALCKLAGDGAATHEDQPAAARIITDEYREKLEAAEAARLAAETAAREALSSRLEFITESLNEIATRLNRKEANEVMKIARKDSRQLFTALDDYYERFAGVFSNAVDRSCTAYLAAIADSGTTTDQVVAAWIAAHQSELLSAAECQPEQLLGRMTSVTDGWRDCTFTKWLDSHLHDGNLGEQ